MARGSAALENAHSPSPARPDRPIDLVHLAKQCLGDANLELEVLRLYDTTIKTYISRLKLATTFDELVINLHSLKGASSGVGAFGIADMAKRAENELRAGRPVTPEQVADIAIAVEEVGVFITGMLKNEPA
ncbi:Hpt domain-containing protein [Devosia sp.]|uniref:Hpt domain-containing protein n=1 Tax=Devosia sp. TaxID=1871048 RepID=UPI0032648BD7